MQHIAIMKKSWGLTEKILSGEKKIESRWYNVKYRPWDMIRSGEIVYFKDSGEPVTIKAEVAKVVQFSGLTPAKVKKILKRYGEDDGIERGRISEFYERFKDKKYCILIFLKAPTRVEPFDIDKTGFGAMAAWITTDDVRRIRKM